MLDIVIPHYKEAWEIGEKLFRMIALQRCIDFADIRVTVVNDGGHALPEDKLKDLPYAVNQLNIPHGGVSKARNAGIEHATEKWIMFCDFDDNFASLYALREILNVLGSDDYDMLWSRIMAEDYIEGRHNVFFTPEKQKFVFCHGKVYLRKLLMDTGIRFREELVFQEDSCFNAEIVAATPYQRIGEIRSPMPIYVWIRREQSVTTSGREDEAAWGHFRRNQLVTEKNEIHNDGRYSGMVTRTVWDTYFMVHSNRNSGKMKRRVLDEFVPWIEDRMDAFMCIDVHSLEQVRAVSRMELVDNGEEIDDDPEKVTKWVKALVDNYRKAR